jgi:hypothetical protein
VQAPLRLPQPERSWEWSPRDEAGERRFNTVAHWVYGTTWGTFREVLDVIGLRGPVASLVHLIAVLGAEQALLPALGVAAPTPSYGAKAAATDAGSRVPVAWPTTTCGRLHKQSPPGRSDVMQRVNWTLATTPLCTGGLPELLRGAG